MAKKLIKLIIIVIKYMQNKNTENKSIMYSRQLSNFDSKHQKKI
jgi:hypothetical protein